MFVFAIITLVITSLWAIARFVLATKQCCLSALDIVINMVIVIAMYGLPIAFLIMYLMGVE